MSVNRGIRGAIAVACVMMGSVSVAGAAAQQASAPALRATLRGFDEEALLAILDRSGSYFGRVSEEGILQRFNPRIDGEYDIDFVSFAFLLSEENEWYQHESGARFWTGSVNHIQLIQHAEFAAAVDLGGSWTARAHLTHQQNLHARRSLVQLAIRRDVASRKARVFVAGTLKEEKSDADIEAGVTWRSAAGEVTVAVAALDVFSDFIQQELGVGGLTDTVLDYTAHPVTGRIGFDFSLPGKLRLEGYALAMTRAHLVVGEEDRLIDYFDLAEDYAYAGVLMEWSPNPGTALGATSTWVRARGERWQLGGGLGTDNFDQVEATRRIGGYAMQRLGARFTVEAWLARVLRSEDRLSRPPSTRPSVTYRDYAWIGRADVAYRSPSGFRAELGFDLAARGIGDPGSWPAFAYLADNHARLRLDIGWRFGRNALFKVGTNADLDQDNGTAVGWFDGGHGRFAIYW